MTPRSDLPLRRLLLADAASCVALGGILSVASGPLAGLTALPSPLLLAAGLALLPVAGFIAWVATRAAVPAAGVRLVVAGNLLWVAASAGLLVSGAVSPNALGTAFVGAQALVVALLAALEHAARRGAPSPEAGR